MTSKQKSGTVNSENKNIRKEVTYLKKFRAPLIASISCLLISSIIGLTKQNLSLVTLSDSLFLFMLFFLIIGGFLSVFSSGFFDFFQFSMRKAITRKEKRDLPYTKLSEVGSKNYQFWLLTTGILFLSSMILLLLSFI